MKARHYLVEKISGIFVDKHETDKQLSLSRSWEPVYIGDYRDNQHHGQGIHTCPDGEKLVGEFKDGEFVEEK